MNERNRITEMRDYRIQIRILYFLHICMIAKYCLCVYRKYPKVSKFHSKLKPRL